MAQSWVSCSVCSKDFLKDNRHINQNKKIGHKFYCSIECQALFKNKRVQFYCGNSLCGKEFRKRACQVMKHNYCSRSCAVTVNNTKFPKRTALIRKCAYCNKEFFRRGSYCSIKCCVVARSLAPEEIINRIHKFFGQHGRIPVKREASAIYKPARKYFGTWNKAIEAAGFKPNPIMFADKCIANDGHICDSVAEKIIDDYLSERKITHERAVPYPNGNYTFDFKIGNIYVEYFGLAGEHKRYDELQKIKQKIIKKYNLQLVEIYPKDLHPHSTLERILGY